MWKPIKASIWRQNSLLRRGAAEASFVLLWPQRFLGCRPGEREKRQSEGNAGKWKETVRYMFLLPDVLILSHSATKTILFIRCETLSYLANGPYGKMNTSICTTNSRNLNSFMFSQFCSLISFFYPWRHSLLVNFVRIKRICSLTHTFMSGIR